MDKEYYIKYYNYEREHWWFKARAKIITDQLKPYCLSDKKYSILNIGAATGHSTEILSEFGDVTTVEYDKDCCDFLKNKLGIDVINASITELPFENHSFDIVCAFDVIEHVDDDVTAVNEMLRVSKSDGAIYITVPAFMSLWSYHDEVNHHKRRYIKSQLLKLFDGLNGSVYCTYFSCILFIPVFIFRKFLNLIGKKHTNKAVNDFDRFNGKAIGSLFYFIFSIERYLLKIFKLPFGSSLLLFYKKNKF